MPTRNQIAGNFSGGPKSPSHYKRWDNTEMHKCAMLYMYVLHIQHTTYDFLYSQPKERQHVVALRFVATLVGRWSSEIIELFRQNKF